MRFTGFAVLSFLLLAGGCAAGCAGGDSATEVDTGGERAGRGGSAGNAGAAGKSGGAGKASAGAAGVAGTTGSGGASVSGGSGGAAGTSGGSAGSTGKAGAAGSSGSAGGGMGALCVRTEDCTGVDICTGNNGVACIGGFCKPTGQPQACDDAVACTKDTCDPAKNKCVHTPDDTVCTGGSFCDPGKNCVEQLPCTVADATCDRLNKNVCDGLWSCSATSLTCVKAPPACEPRTNAKTTCAPATGGNPPTCSYTCNDGFNDLNQDIGVPQGQKNDGCECGGATATLDVPTLENKDKNCDGIVGTIADAIFVDIVSGKDTNAGTMDAPVKTISKGLSVAGAAGKDIYVSKGIYAESVTMVAGVNMYGGYDAAKKWARAEENETTIQSPTEIGVRAVAIDKETEIQSFSIIAKDAVGTAPNGDGISSYGILIVDAVAKVTVRGCVVSAGDGTDGNDGTKGEKGANGQSGGNASGGTKGQGGVSSCGATGGEGGNWSRRRREGQPGPRGNHDHRGRAGGARRGRRLAGPVSNLWKRVGRVPRAPERGARGRRPRRRELHVGIGWPRDGRPERSLHPPGWGRWRLHRQAWRRWRGRWRRGGHPAGLRQGPWRMDLHELHGLRRRRRRGWGGRWVRRAPRTRWTRWRGKLRDHGGLVRCGHRGDDAVIEPGG